MRKFFREEKLIKAFFLTLIGCCIAFLPLSIINGGYFFYYGDYNKEQIMFYTHLHDMVKGGGLSAWDWAADLGSDTAASYSFYLLGSPFFWLSLLFPSSVIIGVIPYLMAVKSGIAAVGAYLLTRRFCTDKTACMISGVLYGMSSFLAVSVIYNHFHDAVLMLPFMLWALERLVNENKRFVFAAIVAIACLTDYYFFFGQAVFTVMYYFVGVFTGRFKITVKSFLTVLFEALLGFALAMFLFLPSAYAVLGNPRVSRHMEGLEWVVYHWKRIYIYIIKNMFMFPNIPLIKNYGLQVSNLLDATSYTTYIPFYSAVGIIAYFRTVKGRDFLKTLLGICVVMMFVPFLNQIFSFFNSMFYGRWFYMPVLIGTVMTAKMIEEHYGTENKVLKKGYLPTAVITGIVLGASAAVMYLDKLEVIRVGFEDYTLPLVQIVMTLVSMGVLWLMIYHPETDDPVKAAKILFNRTFVICTAGMCTVVWYAYMRRGTSEEYKMVSSVEMREDSLSGELTREEGFYRTGTCENYMNMPVLWGEKSVCYFNSTVEPSIIEFYALLGISREAKSMINSSYYPMYSLLSARYYYDEALFDADGNAKPIENTLQGTQGTFTSVEQRHDINIYENTEFIPMGFAVPYAVSEESLEGYQARQRQYILLEALVLSDEDRERYSDYVGEYDMQALKTAPGRYSDICEARRSESCYYFKEEGSSFEGKIKLPEKRLVFFSVPYSEFWSAEVNGEKTDIIVADNGLMAVPCEAGESDIVFTYENKALSLGIVISAVSGAVFIGYVIAYTLMKKRKREE